LRREKIQSKENKKKGEFIFYFGWPENGRVVAGGMWESFFYEWRIK
jgi:hypothetical protein